MIDRRLLYNSIFLVSLGGFALAFVPKADAQWYGSVHAGPAFLDDADISDSVAGGGITGTSSSDTGYDIGGAVGYSWGKYRLEGEISYRANDLKEVNVETISVGSSVFTVAGALAAKGNVSALGFMSNGWYDFDTGTKWVPFAGAGLGFAVVNLSVDSLAGVPVSFDESDTVFAYQAGAGIAYRLRPETSVSVAYRYFGTTDPKFDNGTEQIESQYSSHNIMFGILTRF